MPGFDSLQTENVQDTVMHDRERLTARDRPVRYFTLVTESIGSSTNSHPDDGRQSINPSRTGRI
jgi:hypothetical protein